MHKLRISLLTNMIPPYRMPFFRHLHASAGDLRVLYCVNEEADRQWGISEKDFDFPAKQLAGFTFNQRAANGTVNIIHLRIGIFWELLRRRPDVLVMGDASWTTYLALMACTLLRIRYVVWSESTLDGSGAGLLKRLLYRRACACIAASSMTRAYLTSGGVRANRIRVVNNAVNNDGFLAFKRQLHGRKARIRQEMGVPEDAFVFLYVGQLIERKRVMETMRAMGNIQCRRPVCLLVVGNGELEAHLREQAELQERKVIFCGQQSGEGLARAYMAADALVLLSRVEPWGMVVNEAIVYGLDLVLCENVAAKDLISVDAASRIVASDLNNLEAVMHEVANADRFKTLAILPSPEHMARQFMEVILEHG